MMREILSRWSGNPFLQAGPNKEDVYDLSLPYPDVMEVVCNYRTMNTLFPLRKHKLKVRCRLFLFTYLFHSN